MDCGDACPTGTLVKPTPIEETCLSKLPYVVAAVAVGGFISLQPGLNADVARRIGSPFAAAFLSIGISFAFALFYILSTRQSATWAAAWSLPWYLWIPGVIGFVFVAVGLWLAPILGASTLFASIVAGQLISATIVDQLGVGGYEAHAFDPWRIVAVALVLSGVWLFQLRA